LLKRLLRDLRWGVLPVPGRVMALVFVAFIFIFPLIVDSPYNLLVFILVNIFVIFAVSWDVLSGYTGQTNFGHALTFGVGAYGAALLNRDLGWPPAATIPVASLAAALIGVGTCLPALRLRGPYLALYTLSLPLMLLGIVRTFREITGGDYGISGISRLADTRIAQYYIVLIVMVVAVLIMWKLTDAGSKLVRTGLIFHAIREDEIAARATGINTIRYKILAFAIGSFFAGLSGALYVHIMRIVTPDVLALTLSFQAIIWVIFGGAVSIYGAVVGVYTLYPLLHIVLRDLSHYRMLILAVLVIVVLLFMPEGVAVWVRSKIERQCPRCKTTNAAHRRECRSCSAALRHVA